MPVFNLLATALLTMIMLLISVIVYSLIRTAGGTRYSLVFYEQDKYRQPGRFVKRRYRSLFHFLYRLGDTLRYLYPLLRIFVFRTIPPAFREKILITTAISNSCPQ